MKDFKIVNLSSAILFFIAIAASATSTEKLSTYQATSKKFDEALAAAKYGEAAFSTILKQKQMVDNLISVTVMAKDCSALQNASPTLRPGDYVVYPSQNINKPEVVNCQPINTTALLLLLNEGTD